MSFIIAFSSSRLLLIQGFKDNINSIYFSKFIDKLCQILSSESYENQNEHYVIFDNASIHV